MRGSRYLAWLLILAGAGGTFTWGCKGPDENTVDPGPAACANSPRKALSLKVLQKVLGRLGKDEEIPSDAGSLAGITWLEGYVGDRERSDLVLVGRVCEALPALHVDDLIVALRSAWLKYAELRDHTYYITNPGCSIDPNETVLAKLRDIGQRMNAAPSSENMDALIEQWRRVAASPQTVRILGIPFDSRFGAVTVKADYDMKSIVDGSDDVGVSGLESVMGMVESQAKEDLSAGKPLTIPTSMTNRFWFHPGKCGYHEAPGSVRIQRCPVMLSTEEEYLAAKGELAGTGRANPYAQRFATGFSERYRQVAEKRPAYHELEGLFRFVAVARVMRYKSAPEENGLDISYLLERHALAEVPVDRTVPGRFNLRKYEHRTERPDGHETTKLWLPACGGVGIDLKADKSNVWPDSSGATALLASKVLGQRPPLERLFWTVL